MNLVKLHSFVFIQSRQETPKPSGVQAISEQHSHSHSPVLICATATLRRRQLQFPHHHPAALPSQEHPTRHSAGASQAYTMYIIILGA